MDSDGHKKVSRSRGSNGFWRPRVDCSGECHHLRGSGASRRSDQRAKISGILNSIGDQKKGTRSASTSISGIGKTANMPWDADRIGERGKEFVVEQARGNSGSSRANPRRIANDSASATNEGVAAGGNSVGDEPGTFNEKRPLQVASITTKERANLFVDRVLPASNDRFRRASNGLFSRSCPRAAWRPRPQPRTRRHHAQPDRPAFCGRWRHCPRADPRSGGSR